MMEPGPKKNLDAFLKRMIDVEQSHVTRLNDLLTSTDNELVRAIAESIMYDSKKHASLYTALAKFRQREVSESVNYVVEQDLIDALRRHIEVEADMIKEVESLMPGDLSRLEKGFLDEILADERRHHVMLTALIDLVLSSTDRMEKFYVLADVLSNPDASGPVGRR